jgi:hypothetical protein
LYPQQYKLPDEVTAHDVWRLVVTCVTPVTPETTTGVVRIDVVPSPTRPYLLLPQQFRELDILAAHVCKDVSIVWATVDSIVPSRRSIHSRLIPRNISIAKDFGTISNIYDGSKTMVKMWTPENNSR